MNLQNFKTHKTGQRPFTLLFILILLALSLGTAVAASGNSITIPDSVGSVGHLPKLVLDSSGNPVIVYLDGETQSFNVMHCNDQNCAGGDESISAPTTDIVTFGFHDIALDSDGNPIIVYTTADDPVSPTIGIITLMHCNDPNCVDGDESVTSIVEAFPVGFVSLQLDSSGFPVVSYATIIEFNTLTYALTVLHCNDVNCSGGDESIQSADIVSDVSSVFFETVLALDSSGNPVVFYLDDANTELKLLHCNDPNCAGGDESINSVADGHLTDFDMVLDASGDPVLTYGTFGPDGKLFIQHCNDPNCTGNDENIGIIDESNKIDSFPSIALDGNGYPVISAFASTNSELVIIHCNDVNCQGDDESITAPDDPDSVGYYASIVLDSNGFPVVAFFEEANADLKLLHCGDANCTVSVNTAPMADAGGLYDGVVNNAIPLDGATASDADGDALSYSWTINSDACSFSDATALNPTVTCTEPGFYALTLTGDDGMASSSDSTALTIYSPEQAIRNLFEEIGALEADGTLKKGQANGLRNPLENALRSLDKGNTAAACTQLADFIAEVEAKTPDPLDAETAAFLIADAEAIRTAIGCSS